MGSKRISELIPIDTLDGADLVPVVDVSTGVTKRVTINDLREAGSDKSYVHEQLSSSTTWTVTHNLSKYPSITVVDSSGNVCVGSVNYVSANQLTVTFRVAFSGKAYLN